MRERAVEVGGILSIEPCEAAGTRVHARLPVATRPDVLLMDIRMPHTILPELFREARPCRPCRCPEPDH